jgi:hypothetical protein
MIYSFENLEWSKSCELRRPHAYLIRAPFQATCCCSASLLVALSGAISLRAIRSVDGLDLDVQRAAAGRYRASWQSLTCLYRKHILDKLPIVVILLLRSCRLITFLAN